MTSGRRNAAVYVLTGGGQGRLDLINFNLDDLQFAIQTLLAASAYSPVPVLARPLVLFVNTEQTTCTHMIMKC